jgi:hypothetical protein
MEREDTGAMAHSHSMARTGSSHTQADRVAVAAFHQHPPASMYLELHTAWWQRWSPAHAARAQRAHASALSVASTFTLPLHVNRADY